MALTNLVDELGITRLRVSGASQSQPVSFYSGGLAQSVNNGAALALNISSLDIGPPQLDITNQNTPLIVNTGVYLLGISAQAAGIADVTKIAVATGDYASAFADVSIIGFAGDAQTSLAPVVISNGSTAFQIFAINGDGAARDFRVIDLVVTRLGDVP